MNDPINPPPPDECPACDEPTAEHGWDSELQVCGACAEAFNEEQEARGDAESHAWDAEFEESDESESEP